MTPLPKAPIPPRPRLPGEEEAQGSSRQDKPTLFCKDCRWYLARSAGLGRCSSPDVCKTSPEDGELFLEYASHARSARSGRCGPDARFYQYRAPPCTACTVGTLLTLGTLVAMILWPYLRAWGLLP